MLIAGVDEVGRGSLAGPVVAAAVILDDKIDIEGIKDSKKIPFNKRKYLDKYIKNQSISWNIALASVDEINRLNILQASLLAMKRAIQGLDQEPEMTLIDGIHLPELEVPSKAVIKGDSKIKSIMSASIIAKVARDEMMLKMDRVYPLYKFKQHKGYPTKLHLSALELHGPCSEHRSFFKPVEKYSNLDKN